MNIKHTIAMGVLALGLGMAQAQQLTLTDAIRIGTENSLDAKLARFSFMSEYWTYRSFKAELLPSVNLGGTLMNFDHSKVSTRNYDTGRINYVDNNTLTNSFTLSLDQNIVATGGTISLQSYLYRLDQYDYDSRLYNSQPLRINYTQPLRAFNSLKWEKKTAPLEYQKAQREYLEQMEDVRVTVVGLFFSVLSAQSVYQQSEATLSDRRRLMDMARKRFEIGTTSKSEVLQLELSLLNAEVERTKSQLSLRNSLFSLFNYLRVTDYDSVQLVPPFTLPDLQINASEVLERALANSSHNLDQKVTLLESEKALAQAKASRGLQMTLTGEVGFNQTSDHFANAYRHMNDNEIVGVTFSLPIFDWGVSRGQKKMAEANLEVTRTQLEKDHEEYVQDLQTKVLEFNILASQCRNAQRAQDIADERYDITRRRFENGAVSVTDLNTAQQEAETARAQYITELETFWSSYYALRKATLYDWVMHTDLTADFDQLVK